MKIKLLLVLFLFILSVNLSAQEYIIRVKKLGSNKYFYINENGEFLSGQKYIMATDFSEQGVGMVLLKSNSNYLIIDKKEQIIKSDVPLAPFINEWTGEVYGFSHGIVRTKFIDKVGALNTHGKLTVPAIYSKLSDFNGNYAVGSIGKTFYVVKNNGDQTKLEFENVKDFRHFSDGLAPIKIGKLWGVIDTLGQFVVEPQFKSIGYYSGGLAWAKNLSDKVGYINKQGEWIIKPHYDVGMAYDKTSGLARVKKYNEWGYVDSDSHCDKLNVSGSFHNFNEGLAIKRSDSKVGFINNKGEWVIKPVFDKVYHFENGFARVGINGIWGLIDKEGKWLLAPKYKFIGKAVKIKD